MVYNTVSSRDIGRTAFRGLRVQDVPHGVDLKDEFEIPDRFRMGVTSLSLWSDPSVCPYVHDGSCEGVKDEAGKERCLGYSQRASQEPPQEYEYQSCGIYRSRSQNGNGYRS